MLRRRLIACGAALAALAGGAPAAAQSTPVEGFQEGVTVSGMNRTVGMAYAPDGRVFAVEKGGRLWVSKDGALRTTPVVDFRAKVNSYSDRGMLGVAVDKDFATNGYVYLLYTYELAPTTPDQSGPAVSRLTRIRVNADNTVANPSDPETVILGTYASGPCPPPSNTVDCIPADFYWHTIGTVRVDPVDGTLWLGSGDTTSGATQQSAFRTYDEQSFAGKLIHIDREGRGLPGHPFCKTENDLTKVCTKLHAKGFRNPFRFTLRPNKHPIVGDVGYATQEELDIAAPGGNYGWPCYEGSGRTPGYRNEPGCAAQYANEGTELEARKPIYSYPHGEGASITAGPQYDGSAYPAEYRGDIFFGDYVQGWIKRLEVTADDTLVSVQDFATNVPAYTDLQQDPQGRIAFMDVGGLQTNLAAIRHYEHSANRTPVAVASATPASGALPLAVSLEGDGSSDPDGDPLTYDWDFGDGSAHATTANASHTYTTDGVYTAKLTVTDAGGRSDSDTVTIRAGTVNEPPVAQITSPSPSLTYAAGDTIQLSATANDPEDGPLSGESVSWQVVLRHNTHLHEHVSATGTTASFFAGNDHDADSHFEIRLKVTDSSGATDEETVAIQPKTVKLTLNSSPPGAPVVYAGAAEQASPLSVRAAVGFAASISAAESFVRDGRTYRFTAWSDGQPRSHGVTVPAADKAYVARYTATGVETSTVTPTADTTVNSSTPTMVRGASTQIGVDASPQEQALLRFDVSGVAARRIAGARLALYGRDGSPAGGRVFRTATDAWSEESTTWENRPALAGPQLGALGAVRATEWFEVPLSGGIGDGSLSLGLDSVNSDGADYSSREAASKPELTLEVDPRRPAGAGAPAVRADFDGDGKEDLAVAAPEEDATALRDTGVVHVLYGGASGIGARGQAWTQDSPGVADSAQAGDAFGAGLAAGDFDGDGRADLAIGVPGEDTGAGADSGLVHVLRGGATGLTATGSTLWTQSSPSVPDEAGAGDAFGAVLAAGDATGDGRADLAVGVPWEDLGTKTDAGVVNLLPGSAGGLTGTGAQLWSQDSPGVTDAAVAGDELGGALAFGDVDGDGRADLAVGAPREDIGAAPDAGVVHLLRGAAAGLTATGSQLLAQSTADVPDSPQPGDRFGERLVLADFGGTAHAELAVAAPAEDIGAVADAGTVHVFAGGASGPVAAGSRQYTQNTAGVADAAEAGDEFGAALAAGRFTGGAVAALAIGAPGETGAAGVVHVLPGSASGVTTTGSRLWSQDSPGVADVAGPSERFGASLTAVDATSTAADDLVAGVPGQSVGFAPGAGALHVLPGSTGGLTATGSSQWSQDSPGIADAPERGDGFGGALGGG